MDKGTDAMNILLGRHIPLKHGWIGVVNRFIFFQFYRQSRHVDHWKWCVWICYGRSQKDIQQKKPITEALRDEKEFFAKHPLYSTLGDRIGTQYLAIRCNEVSKTVSKFVLSFSLYLSLSVLLTFSIWVWIAMLIWFVCIVVCWMVCSYSQNIFAKRFLLYELKSKREFNNERKNWLLMEKISQWLTLQKRRS
jgi:hypothetical protein